MMTAEQKKDDGESVAMTVEPGRFHLTPGNIITILGPTNAMIKAITTEFSERIRKAADAVVEQEEKEVR